MGNILAIVIILAVVLVGLKIIKAIVKKMIWGAIISFLLTVGVLAYIFFRFFWQNGRLTLPW